jgi:hypothetical protein
MKSVPRELVRLLTRPSEGRDYALLKQLFALDLPTETAVATKTGEPEKAGAGDEGGESDFETMGSERSIALQKLRGGFRIKGLASGGRSPRRATILVAYEVRRGNPFRQYHPLDFDLSQPPIELNGKNVRVTACQNNGIILEPEQSRFELTVRGFDPHRDLRVRLQPIDDGAS